MGAILSFLGGSAFRFLIGQLTDYLQKKQDHLYEIERIKSQEAIDAAAHLRQLAMIQLQADLKLGEIKLAGMTAVDLEEAKAFTAAQAPQPPTGVKFIDAWNGSIRPLCATIAIGLWGLRIVRTFFELTAWDENLIASILGYYFADRHIGKSKA
jgi:hypothetical protein